MLAKTQGLVWIAAGILVAGLGGPLPADAKTIVEIHNTMNPGGSEEAGLLKFKELLEKRSDGRFDVKVYLGGQLGGETEVLELLKLGQTHVALTGTTFMVNYAAEYDALDIPFVLPTMESNVTFLDTASGKKIKELSLQRGGIRHLALQERGARQTTSNRAIRKVEDLKGLKMRLPPQPSWMAVWEGFGVQTVVLPAGDIYLAMRTGQIDSHENTLSSPYSRQMWEVQKYIILTNHLSQAWSYVASENWLKKLSEADREMVRQVAVEAGEFGGKVEREKQQFYIDALRGKGMEIISVDVEKFAQAAQPAIKKLLGAMAPGVIEDVQRALEMAKAKK